MDRKAALEDEPLTRAMTEALDALDAAPEVRARRPTTTTRRRERAVLRSRRAETTRATTGTTARADRALSLARSQATRYADRSEIRDLLDRVRARDAARALEDAHVNGHGFR